MSDTDITPVPALTEDALAVCPPQENGTNIRRCPYCGFWFEPKIKANRRTRFCSDAHRLAYVAADRKARRLQRRLARRNERMRSQFLTFDGRISGPINSQNSPVLNRDHVRVPVSQTRQPERRQEER